MLFSLNLPDNKGINLHRVPIPMHSFSVSITKILLTGGLVMVFCLLNSSFVHAQSDRDRPFADVVKPRETVQPSKEIPSDYSTVKRETAEKMEEGRDQSGYRDRSEKDEREGRAEAKSTLSFNLFLYVIDRFKEN